MPAAKTTLFVSAKNYCGDVQIVDSGLAQGSCFFRNGAADERVDHGYLKDADGFLSTGDFQYDLSMRKVVQCKRLLTRREEVGWGVVPMVCMPCTDGCLFLGRDARAYERVLDLAG